MPRLQPLNDDNKQMLQAIIQSKCLDGMCYEFAIAVAEATGLPLYGLWSQTASGDDGVPGTWRHAFVRLSEKFYFDARGPIEHADLAMFGDIAEHNVRPITAEMLAHVRPIATPVFPMLVKFSQALWPMLPWKQNTFQHRLMAFLTDLEALSQKHQVWIRAPYPTPGMMPIVTTDGAEESPAYVAQTTVMGDVIFDRTFDGGSSPL